MTQNPLTWKVVKTLTNAVKSTVHSGRGYIYHYASILRQKSFNDNTIIDDEFVNSFDDEATQLWLWELLSAFTANKSSIATTISFLVRKYSKAPKKSKQKTVKNRKSKATTSKKKKKQKSTSSTKSKNDKATKKKSKKKQRRNPAKVTANKRKQQEVSLTEIDDDIDNEIDDDPRPFVERVRAIQSKKKQKKNAHQNNRNQYKSIFPQSSSKQNGKDSERKSESNGNADHSDDCIQGLGDVYLESTICKKMDEMKALHEEYCDTVLNFSEESLAILSKLRIGLQGLAHHVSTKSCGNIPAGVVDLMMKCYEMLVKSAKAQRHC